MADSQRTPGAARFLGAIFGFVFGGIGLTVIGFLWTMDGFGAPPLFFRIFASFIALAFVAMGGTLLFGSLKGASIDSDTSTASPHSKQNASTTSGYVCPACGARLGQDADVSPKGDVKCGYCRKWFNVHG
jgi:hypothetical protein